MYYIYFSNDLYDTQMGFKSDRFSERERNIFPMMDGLNSYLKYREP
ncbi:MAG: hypothetical protein QXH07_02175 [Thermoplasmata archaeon]